MKLLLSFLLTMPLLVGHTFAANKVAKVIMMRGTAMEKLKDGKMVPIKKGQWVVEGSQIQTQDKSFVRLLFQDKSSMNVGPKSTMEITKFEKGKPGIISVIGGQIRSKVTKDVLKKDQGSKMYVKTKTAAMGIRGTDFQVAFNPKNGNTAVVTFEGQVAMAQTRPGQEIPDNPAVLERAVTSEQASQVVQGSFSMSTPKLRRPTVPTKIAPAQYNAMKDDNAMGTQNTQTQRHTFKSPIPPGVDPKAFTPKENALDSQMAATVGQQVMDTAVEVANRPAETPIGDVELAPVDGMLDKDSGKFAPRAGGPIDLEKVVYVPPPKDAPLDPTTGLPQLPPEIGGVCGSGFCKSEIIKEISDNGEIKVDAQKLEEYKQEIGSSGTEGTDGGGLTTLSSLEDGGAIPMGEYSPEDNPLEAGHQEILIEQAGGDEGALPPPPEGEILLADGDGDDGPDLVNCSGSDCLAPTIDGPESAVDDFLEDAINTNDINTTTVNFSITVQ